MVLQDLPLEKSSLVVTPRTKRPMSEKLLLLAGAKHLNAEDTTLCKTVNYLSVDCPDLSFGADFLTRGMKSSMTQDVEELKRVGRYLRGRQVGAIVFEPQTSTGVLEVFCDADRARTRQDCEDLGLQRRWEN